MPPRASIFLRQLGCLILLPLALLVVSCSAHSQDTRAPLVQSLAWKIDTSGQATLADMQAANDWQTFDGMENWGFGDAPIWVRYTLRAALPHETEPWIVRIQPAFLENLTLYDPVSQRVLQSGLNFSGERQALDSLNFTFEVAAMPKARDIYLRLQSKRSRLIHTNVVPLRDAVAQNQLMGWFIGFLISIAVVFALLSSVQWVMTREPVMGAFALKQWIATLWALSNVGFMRIVFGGFASLECLNIFNFQVRMWTVAGTMWFFLVLIKDYQPSQIWWRTSLTWIGFVLLLPFLQFANLTILMGVLSNVGAIVGLLLIWLTFLSSPSVLHTKPPLPRLFLVIYLFFYLLINTPTLLTYLDLIPMYPVIWQANLSHIFLDGLVMFQLLQLRARNVSAQAQHMVEQNQAIAIQLDRVQQSMLLEKQRRHEQSQFLHMLMHELKTPLSIVSLALGMRQNREENMVHAGRAVQDMKVIIDRCILADQTGEPTLPQHRQHIGVDHLLHQLVQTMPLLSARVQWVVPGTVPLIKTDEQFLKIILVNLLENATHYSDPLTPVSVTLSPTPLGGQAGLSVRISNTPGLAGWPDTQQVFSKYYRASGAQRESGSGLGLFLSRQLAHSLGGMLTYAPSLQHVEFDLWLPLLPA